MSLPQQRSKSHVGCGPLTVTLYRIETTNKLQSPGLMSCIQIHPVAIGPSASPIIPSVRPNQVPVPLYLLVVARPP